MRLTFIVLWLLSLSVMAAPLDDKVDALKEALKTDPIASPQPSNGAFPGRPMMSAEAEEAALNQITSGQAGQYSDGSSELIINQILSNHSSDAVQKAGRELLDEIEAEQKAEADARVAEIDGVLKRLADILPKATKPSDLDAILVDLQKYQTPAYPMGNEDQQRLSQQAAMAYQFATGWQDYLSSLANGNADQARNELRTLAQNGFGITIVPRSHILELMNAPINVPPSSPANIDQATSSPTQPTVDDILNKVQTLDQMEPALKQIQDLNLPYGSAQTGTIQTLQNYVQCYHDIKSGLPANLNLSNGIQGLPGHEDITRKVWLLALQALFPSFKGSPIPDEKPLDFVNRVIADAANREDWDQLKKALDAKENVTKSTEFGLYFPDPASGMNLLISALNQEAAGQYSLAVTSYEAALKSPSLDIPAKMIGEKLAAIQKDHPTEFQTGYQQTISPPMRSSYPGMPYTPGMPGYPNPRPGMRPPGAILSIPGRDTPPVGTNSTLSPAAPDLKLNLMTPNSPGK